MNAPDSLENLQHAITQQYGTLSKRLQQVARFLLEHPSTVALETVANLAQQADVPPSTLVRFAAAFGYNGFSEMQNLFRQVLVEQSSSYSERVQMTKSAVDVSGINDHAILSEFTTSNVFSMSHLPHHLNERQLNQAVSMLESTSNIYIVGLRRSFPISTYLAYSLRHLDRPTHLIDANGGMLMEQASNIRENDVLVATAFSPYAKETVKVAEFARSKGAKILSITDSKLSPLAALSDVCFDVKEAEVMGFRSLTSSMTVAQTLLVCLAYRLDRDGLLVNTNPGSWNQG